MSLARFSLLALGSLAVALAAGCGGNRDPIASGASRLDAATATTAAVNSETNVNLIAHATVPEVAVFATPGAGERPVHLLGNPTANGGPLVFLVERTAGEWVLVNLPVRPNGSTGWVRSSDVTLTQHDYSIVVELAAHRITVRRGREVILAEPVAVGTRDTPTPGGRFYITELLMAPDPNTVYGPYAYGLSGFSNALSSFAGGEAIIGIHGNNDEASLGSDVSAGCIRMSNAGIRKLARTLPLGTPVHIEP